MHVRVPWHKLPAGDGRRCTQAHVMIRCRGLPPGASAVDIRCQEGPLANGVTAGGQPHRGPRQLCLRSSGQQISVTSRVCKVIRALGNKRRGILVRPMDNNRWEPPGHWGDARPDGAGCAAPILDCSCHVSNQLCRGLQCRKSTAAAIVASWTCSDPTMRRPCCGIPGFKGLPKMATTLAAPLRAGRMER